MKHKESHSRKAISNKIQKIILSIGYFGFLAAILFLYYSFQKEGIRLMDKIELLFLILISIVTIIVIFILIFSPSTNIYGKLMKNNGTRLWLSVIYAFILTLIPFHTNSENVYIEVLHYLLTYYVYFYMTHIVLIADVGMEENNN